MTVKNIKIALFGAVFVALILSFNGLDFVTAEQPTTAKQIQKPEKTQAEIDERELMLSLFTERLELKQSASDLRKAVEENGLSSLSSEDIQKLEAVHERLKELTAKIENVNSEARKLFAMTPEAKIELTNAKQIIRDSGIPYQGLGTDKRVGALTIGFSTQEEADKYISTINKIIGVPYYIEIGPADTFGSCTNLDSNCDPLMGGIMITTQYDNFNNVECSYSIPAVRNVFWWTETGFISAGHCYSGSGGWDTWQPTDASSKIGDVTARVLGGECDCAFSQKTGSESTLFGNWIDTDTSNQLLSKGDPLDGDYVIMVGHESGVQIGQVIDDEYDTGTNPSIQNTYKIDTAMDHGDSGGPTIDLTTENVYHGLISSFNTGGDYTAIVPWSHIDNGLDLQ